MLITLIYDAQEKVTFTLTIREWLALIDRDVSLGTRPEVAEALQSAYKTINAEMMKRGI